jgi:hypothetical protein
MQAPKNGFFYVIDRVTGKLISADPITKVSWSLGVDPQTGKMLVNPAARYGTTAITVNPGPSGGHVWPSWTFSPHTGLVYFPGNAGQGSSYSAAEEYEMQPVEIGPTGRGVMNMGTSSFGGGGGKGKAKGPVPGADTALPDAVAAAQGKGKGAPAAQPAKPAPLASIGPQNETITGTVLYAWNPVTRREAWRAKGGGAGPFSGGALATAGNIVFSSVDSNLMAYDARTGEELARIPLPVSQMAPPISIRIDGKQYVFVAGAAPRGGGGAGKGGAPPAAVPGAPATQKLVALTLP